MEVFSFLYDTMPEHLFKQINMKKFILLSAALLSFTLTFAQAWPTFEYIGGVGDGANPDAAGRTTCVTSLNEIDFYPIWSIGWHTSLFYHVDTFRIYRLSDEHEDNLTSHFYGLTEEGDCRRVSIDSIAEAIAEIPPQTGNAGRFLSTNGTTSSWTTLIISNTSTLDFSSTNAGESSDLTITVTGAALGDPVSLGVPHSAVISHSCYTAWVSSANTVTVRFNNYNSISPADPSSATFKATVLK